MKAMRNKLFPLILLSVFFLGNGLLATTNNSEFTAQKVFDQHFKLIKDNKGNLLYVQKKMQLKKFKLEGFLNKLKFEIKEELDVQNTFHIDADETAYRENLNDLLDIDESMAFADDPVKKDELKNKKRVRRSLLNLRKVNWEKRFVKLENDQIIKDFGKKIKQILKTFDFTVMAAPSDKSFFFKKQIINQVLKEVIKRLRKKHLNIPYLNFATYVVNKVGEFILQDRFFQQNMMMSLMFYNEKDLTLNPMEINHIISSIFESRMDFKNRAERKKLKENWDGYGILQLFSMERTALNNMSKYKNGRNINMAFFEGTFANKKGKQTQGYYHHFLSNHQFTQKKALAFDVNNKNRVLRLRALLFVAQAGVNFIPFIPGMIKNLADNFINSMTQEQIKQEGFLYAHLMTEGKQDIAKIIKLQSINPWILLF
jgi:hypothetical protein